MLKRLFCLLPLLMWMSASSQDLNTILDAFNKKQLEHPYFKIYVSHDKPAYVAGETIWFTAILVDGSFHKLNALTQTIYAELLNADGNPVEQLMLNAPLGAASGSLQIPDSVPEGNYTLRAYTNYMRNGAEEFFFHKSIPVLNPDIPASPLSTLQEIDLQFFPEGGTFLIGVNNKVAFKAIGGNGKSIEVSGEIIDEKGTVVTPFKSEYLGMGLIELIPAPGKSYKAIIQTPQQMEVDLPSVEFSGYSLQVTDETDHFSALIYRNTTSEAGKINIVAQSRGVICYAAQGSITNSSRVRIPKQNLPNGITQITVFDENGIPKCERLIFVNHGNSMSINITTDQSSYGERQKVSMEIKATDPLADSVDAIFSVSVYDKLKVPNTSEYPVSIVNYLLLNSDLHGHIENPGYYFSSTEETVSAHADLLMRTQGWRRFTWKEMLEGEPSDQFSHERGIPIRGTVTRALSKKGVEDSQIKILNVNTGGLALTEAGENGRFFNDDLIFYDSAELVIQTESKKGNRSEYDLTVDPIFPNIATSFDPGSFSYSSDNLIIQALNRLKMESGYTTAEDVILLDEVSVKATKIRNEISRIYGTPDRTITTENFPKSAVNILDLIRGRFAGVLISGSPLDPTISIRGGGEPLFILDGIQVPKSALLLLPPDQVASIDLIKGNEAAIYGSNGANGVLAFYTKLGYQGANTQTLGMNTKWYQGYHLAREFYSPQYDVQDDRHNLPDERTTLYWNPIVRPDSNGNLNLEFFTADESSTYEIIVEGITLEGNPGTGSTSFNVSN
ncbi:MG2 domain-containing protein [Fulvivirga sedimenti]|uniref:TonB-dependent receptor plug domain-containing protein n=1 Tax=Fulvivirga sedimenti TaxID=2879465 RepID=A0A9X1HKF5_9BACT|nr:MG2 domain-containing protein [Fulvivirga sedimenti]MCA6073476.1 TonB-dependent receptor plug domain-containing protein [Fulvivirga sedimenti]